jgi:pimeloyl-ACP methyl ester carboxylesterase
VARPFERGRFDDLPSEPTRPHPYRDSAAREVTVDSRPFGRMSVHYREWGSGPPLLLVHGLMTTSYSWRYVLEPLGRHFRLIVPDLPGCGRSDKPDGHYGAEAIAVAIGEIQQALGIRGCAAIGNSLGGYLCMRLALSDAGAFSGLVNIHSPGVPEARLHALHGALAVPGMRRLLAWWMRREPLRWAHANVHYHDESLKSVEEAREYGAPLATAEGGRAFTGYLAESLSPAEMRDFVRALEQRREQGLAFPMPLCLISRVDPMVPPRIGERLHALVPSAEMHWLDDSSHFAHVDSPERLVPIALRFLADRTEPDLRSSGDPDVDEPEA